MKYFKTKGVKRQQQHQQSLTAAAAVQTSVSLLCCRLQFWRKTSAFYSFSTVLWQTSAHRAVPAIITIFKAKKFTGPSMGLNRQHWTRSLGASTRQGCTRLYNDYHIITWLRSERGAPLQQQPCSKSFKWAIIILHVRDVHMIGSEEQHKGALILHQYLLR